MDQQKSILSQIMEKRIQDLAQELLEERLADDLSCIESTLHDTTWEEILGEAEFIVRNQPEFRDQIPPE